MEVDPTPEEDGVEADSDGGLGGGLIGELAGSIPGIDEAIVRDPLRRRAGVSRGKLWLAFGLSAFAALLTP